MAEYERWDDITALRIGRDITGDSVELSIVLVDDKRSMHVDDADVPAVAADIHRAMMRAAGHPEPIILDRPDETTQFQLNVGIVDGQVAHTYYGPHDPEVARMLAAAIAAAADLAEREADPAAVADLAKVLQAADTNTVGNPAWPKQMARKILRTRTVTPREDA